MFKLIIVYAAAEIFAMEEVSVSRSAWESTDT